MVTWRDADGVERTEELQGRVRKRRAARAATFWPERVLATLHWYAVLCRAGTEFAVEALLEARGFVAIVPMQTEYRHVNRYVRRKHQVSYPVAPRYVLIGFNETQLRGGARNKHGRLVGARAPWHEVFSITMVQSVVGVDGYPMPMLAKETARFVRAHGYHEAPKEQQHMRTGREFRAGDMVEVVEGSLAGMTVRVHAIVGDKARVLLPLFGKAEQEIGLPLANLEIAD